MGKKRDLNFKTYIWTQFPQKLIRSKVIKKCSTHNKVEEYDSDNPSGDEDHENDDISGAKTFEQVQMLMNDRDFIYYVQKHNGKCIIVEGNPRDPYIENHEKIMSITAEKCLAFTIDKKDNFYFMDENFIVYKMSRNENNRKLTLQKELTMKEIQTLDFKPNDFDSVIMNEKYAIQGNKMFYLYDNADEPFPEGVMESENIVEEKKSGPKCKFV